MIRVPFYTNGSHENSVMCDRPSRVLFPVALHVTRTRVFTVLELVVCVWKPSQWCAEVSSALISKQCPPQSAMQILPASTTAVRRHRCRKQGAQCLMFLCFVVFAWVCATGRTHQENPDHHHHHPEPYPPHLHIPYIPLLPLPYLLCNK
ncbi:hypothetical protein, unlikely [Trypanosoma congolense IL3000]|uniref:Uncharacterized protein n=1 Tax=Trypanosoma congolense (strain IL3000) TaxID=1068625 RepID=F9W6I9_TRYCI|nr:hypothetical protein, unlikely [Trypanosoma congolense IL3000]